MVLGIAVALPEGPYQGGQHFRVDRPSVQQLLCPHCLCRCLHCLKDIRRFFRGHTDRILQLNGEPLLHLRHTVLHFGFAAVAAQGKETGFRSPHIIGLLGEALPHGIRQQLDLLVSHMVSHGAVDH